MSNAMTNTAKRLTMAEQADKHELYEESVQSADEEVEFLSKTFKELRNREPDLLREDFCGTANVACAWVADHDRHRAIGLDINADVLEYGRRKHVGALKEEQRQRVELIESDVRTVTPEKADLAVAFNFSYWIFEDRATLRGYFENIRESLVDDGLFFLDAYGGTESQEESKEKTKYDDFTYIWHQADFDPFTSHMQCYIHFKFPDGSKMKRAFSYTWRLWSLPEIRELLEEAGFNKVTFYWEEEDEDGEGSGEFFPAERGESDPSWVAYIVAEK